MSVHSVSGAALAKSQLSNQKAATEPVKNEKLESNLSSESSLSGGKFEDSVTLSQAEKSGDAAKVLDKSGVDEMLPEAMKAILNNSKAALSAQANIKPEAAIEHLSG